ncbi:hypothetical protein IscW_ISCW021716 [Ixodes scapularis]|uniref:Uncharacterized protein n=1 Tax=Ixodes scapularis TaxID=6945 RepID=B7Q654_IXOSC|nr:hypothetical protein IscW_ISCW021716 [Ixodes scapularis]|eukprot:XP_002411892.1 hypothetical protein IscW_ISCW021716 [Ixodes scapularis]
MTETSDPPPPRPRGGEQRESELSPSKDTQFPFRTAIEEKAKSTDCYEKGSCPPGRATAYGRPSPFDGGHLLPRGRRATSARTCALYRSQ